MVGAEIVLGKRRKLKINQDGIREGYKGLKVKNFSRFKHKNKIVSTDPVNWVLNIVPFPPIVRQEPRSSAGSGSSEGRFQKGLGEL